MFDNSKINSSGLADKKPIIAYDATNLEEKGFKLRYELDPRNPVHEQVIVECKKQNVPYKIIVVNEKKEHIWIKTE